VTETITHWPSDQAATTEPRSSYHGQPVIKAPVWTPEIPIYFFTGGMAGASAGLAALAELRGNQVLGRRAWGISLASVAVSPALLVSDLGRPARFLNMLRMFKVTSPMSVGSWILSGSGAATSLAALGAFTPLLPRTTRAARAGAALLGLPLSTYTAALIANTAVPVWHVARRELPFVFGAGAALSAGAAAAIVTPVAYAAPARRLSLAAAIGELAGEQLMERRLGKPHAEVYESGSPRRYKRISQATITVGAGLMAVRGARSRAAAALAGSLMCAGALATRWSIFTAGRASAIDPKYTVGPQRERIERGESPGAARREPRVTEPDPSLATPATSDRSAP
jgi:hypothetical protein